MWNGAKLRGDFLKEQPNLTPCPAAASSRWRLLPHPALASRLRSAPRLGTSSVGQQASKPGKIGASKKPKQNKKLKTGVGKTGVWNRSCPRDTPAAMGAGVGVGAVLHDQGMMLFASSAQLQRLLLLQGNGCSYSANVDSCSLYILKDNISLLK